MIGRRIALVIAVAASCAACAAVASPNRAAPGDQRSAGPLRTVVERAAPFGFSGAILAATGGEIVLREGFGTADAGRGVPVTPTTVFDIGSVTKQFTAAAILRLQEQGRLTVGDSIGRFFPDAPPDKRGITVHQLLTHTAGLDADGSEDEVIGRDSLVRRVLGSELFAPPGAEWAYSNAGYNLLAAVVEAAAAKPYEQFLREELFRPAGMTRTGYAIPDWPRDSIAHGYRNGEDRGSPLDAPRRDDGPSWNLRGAGGLLSTVDDLERWIRALSAGRVLAPATRDLLLRPHAQMIPGSDLYYGYGWIVEGPEEEHVVWHNGSNTVFWSVVRWDPAADRLLVALTNTQDAGSFPNENVLLLFTDTLFDVLGGAPAPHVPCCVRPSTPMELAAYEGTYSLGGEDRLVVTAAGGGLVVEPIGQHAVSTLLEIDFVSAGEYARLSARAEELSASLLRRDWEALREVAGEGGLDRLRRQLERVLATSAQRHGPLQRARVLGTIGEWWSFPGSGERTPVTFVRLEAQRGDRVFRLHWRDGRISAVGGDQIPGPARILFLATPTNDFVAFHPRLSVGAQLLFRAAHHSGGMDLLIHNGSGRQHVAPRAR